MSPRSGSTNDTNELLELTDTGPPLLSPFPPTDPSNGPNPENAQLPPEPAPSIPAQCQPKQAAAFHAQPTQSHRALIADTGCTHHFGHTQSTHIRKAQATPTPISVRLPNGSSFDSTHTGQLTTSNVHDRLPTTATHIHLQYSPTLTMTSYLLANSAMPAALLPSHTIHVSLSTMVNHSSPAAATTLPTNFGTSKPHPTMSPLSPTRQLTLLPNTPRSAFYMPTPFSSLQYPPPCYALFNANTSMPSLDFHYITSKPINLTHQPRPKATLTKPA